MEELIPASNKKDDIEAPKIVSHFLGSSLNNNAVDFSPSLSSSVLSYNMITEGTLYQLVFQKSNKHQIGEENS